MNFTTGASVAELLSLETIRSQLIRLEDTIIFCESRSARGLGMGSTGTSDLTEDSALIERAQFAYNGKIYEPGAFKGETGFDGSWLEWFLYEIETFHAKARRYTSPDEQPFTPLDKLPSPVITPQTFPAILYPPAADHPSVNANSRILSFYVKHIVPAITSEPGRLPDDGNYGSAATRDVEVLQALSRRIHFAPHDFIPHILASPPNSDALAALITKPAVEAKLLVRLANKARVYGCEMDADGRVVDSPDGGKGKIDIEEVVGLYRDWVIPLTKDVEVDYLIHRLDGVPQETIDAWMSKADASS
ncbi:hypothetical protein JCM24511_09176 [Saitozyma sp. JCM 24511]|nr:hypothetical protein JCM24511_09176 [Saitozyma sp. JCM 24511]